MTKPEVRELGGGAWVVDYGRKWFRLRPNGEITAREVYVPPGEQYGYARTREPNAKEIARVRTAVATAQRSRLTE